MPPDLTEEQILDSARSIDPVIDEAIAAGVWVFGGGLDDEQARYWAAKIAVGCGWPMQVQQLGTPPTWDDPLRADLAAVP